MSEQKQPVSEAPTKETNINKGRRLLSKAALATPVIASLSARPAFGATGDPCSISGFMSGNQSPGHRDYQCGGFGCTPGFWKNNVKAWPPSISPGECKDWNGPHCSEWKTTGATLQSILPIGCIGVTSYFSQVQSGDSLISILNKGVNNSGKVTTEYADVCHYIAAILNATVGGEAVYGSTPKQVQDGLCKAAQEGRINFYTTVLLAGLNERGCMMDAWGLCEQNFTMVAGVCIPMCPTGKHWDTTTMACVPD